MDVVRIHYQSRASSMRAGKLEALLGNPTKSGSTVIAHFYPPIAVGIDEPPTLKTGAVPLLLFDTAFDYCTRLFA